MRLVIAKCSVDYDGRLSAHLPLATRLLLVKADGSVLVHSDGGSYKPLNWMSPPCAMAELSPEEHEVADGVSMVWQVQHAKSEDRLRVLIHEVLHDTSHELGVDPGLIKDGVEAHLQKLLAEHIHTLGDGYTLVRREYMTAIGPVDILCRDGVGGSVAVEIKRRGDIDGVEQLHPLPRADEPRPAPRPGHRRLRCPGDQAAGAHPGAGPRHPLRDPRLRRAPRHRRHDDPSCSTLRHGSRPSGSG